MSNILKVFDPVSKTWKEIGAIKGDKGETGKSAYELAVEGGYAGTEQQFKTEQAAIAANSARLAAVESNKQDKPVAGRTFLTPLFVARGAVFNETTGFYELNGLTDITEGQMATIYNHPNLFGTDVSNMYFRYAGRTIFPMIRNVLIPISTYGVFDNALSVEKIPLVIETNSCRALFYNCRKLNEVIGTITFAEKLLSSGIEFYNCLELTNISLINIRQNFSFAQSSHLSQDSILYMITHSANTTPITVTLHADALARLTAEDIALASTRNITLTA